MMSFGCIWCLFARPGEHLERIVLSSHEFCFDLLVWVVCSPVTTYQSLDKSTSMETTVERSDKWLIIMACSWASSTACWTWRLSTRASVIFAQFWAACMRYSPISLTMFCVCSEEVVEEEVCFAIVVAVTCDVDCASCWGCVTVVFGVVIDIQMW